MKKTQNLVRVSKACIAVMIFALGASSAANATVILSFAQRVDGPTVIATNNAANTMTTIQGTDIPVTIAQYLGGGAPINAYLTFNLVNSGPASTSSGQLLEPYNGSFEFTSLIGRGGINYLSSVFTDFVFGIVGGSSLTLNASQPPGTVTFNSDILAVSSLGLPRALSFAFADVTPPDAIVGSTMRGFTSSVSGSISADVTVVPEPSSIAIFGLGLFGLMASRRRRAAKV